MSTISNSNRPDEGPPSAPPDIVAAPTVIPPPSPARSESAGVGPDRNALGSDALEASRPVPYTNKLRSYKSNKETPLPSIESAGDINRFVRSCGPSLSPPLKRETSPARTVFDEDHIIPGPRAEPEDIDLSPNNTPKTNIMSQLPVLAPPHPPTVSPIPDNSERVPSVVSTASSPVPAPPVTLSDMSHPDRIASAMFDNILSNGFGLLGEGFSNPMPFAERSAVVNALPEAFKHFEREIIRRMKLVEGQPLPLHPTECDVWSEVLAQAHSFASGLAIRLGELGLVQLPESAYPTPAMQVDNSPACGISDIKRPNPMFTAELISAADSIQAAIFAVKGTFITDSNALDIAHDLARAKKASYTQAEARGSTAPSGACAAPRENLSARAGHGTAPAYMDAAPSSALGLSLGPQAAGTDPYGPYGCPNKYDPVGFTNPAPEPLSRAASQITWATSPAPPHETHPVQDSTHAPPTPAHVPSILPPKLPAGPPEVPEFSRVSRNKGKKKNKGLSSAGQTPKMSFAAAASLPVSGIQRELTKINKSSSVPASLPSAPAAQPKQAKDKSPSPPGNLDLIIKVSLDEDRKLILSRASMPESRRCLMRLVTHFNNIVNSKEYRGKTSITPVQFSYGTNGNCYVSFSPATKIEEVELFRPALASCIGISGPFTIIRAGKWAKLMISHVPVWRVDPISGEERHEVNTKNDLMLLLQLFVPNDLLDLFPVQDVRFLRPLDYVCKTNPGGHETIVLSVEDKSGRAFSDYTKNGLNFGYRPCYIREFKDKVRLSECMRCSSYECKKPGNCNKPFVCNLCGGSHRTEVHNKHCPACTAQKLTLISGHVCRCPPKCPACKKDHPFGDLECPTRGRYAPSLTNVLRMEGFTGSRAPVSIHHSPAASGTSARTPRPPTTAPGLINTEASAPLPPAAIAEEDSEMAASC